MLDRTKRSELLSGHRNIHGTTKGTVEPLVQTGYDVKSILKVGLSLEISCGIIYGAIPFEIHTLRACCSQSKFRILKIRESSACALLFYNCTPNISRSADASVSVA